MLLRPPSRKAFSFPSFLSTNRILAFTNSASSSKDPLFFLSSLSSSSPFNNLNSPYRSLTSITTSSSSSRRLDSQRCHSSSVKPSNCSHRQNHQKREKQNQKSSIWLQLEKYSMITSKLFNSFPTLTPLIFSYFYPMWPCKQLIPPASFPLIPTRILLLPLPLQLLHK